ncbi:hypothetical protein EJB05_25475, partial [Eragrostis curvula]
MSQGSSSTRLRNKQALLAAARRVDCPNCRVRACVNIAKTPANYDRMFYKCPYFSRHGCQYYEWADEMEENQFAAPREVDAPVPAREVQGPLAQPRFAPVAEAEPMDLRVIEEKLKWIEKIVFVCVVLVMYSLFFKK